MDQLWESLLSRTIQATDMLSGAERDELMRQLEANPDSLTYTRDDQGWIQVYVAGEAIIRLHVFDLAPRPDAPFLN